MESYQNYFKQKLKEYCKKYNVTMPKVKEKMGSQFLCMLDLPYLYISPSLQDLSEPEVLVTILHEVAHIKFEHYKGNAEEKARYDKEAEFWALDQLKENEPEMFEMYRKELDI